MILVCINHLSYQSTHQDEHFDGLFVMMMMMKLPILPCAGKLELVLSTAPCNV